MKKISLFLLCILLLLGAMTACSKKPAETNAESTPAAHADDAEPAIETNSVADNTDITADALLSTPETAPEQFTVADYEEGSVYIDGYNGVDPIVVIPSVIGGKDVAFIPDSPFRGDKSIVALKLPDSLVKIDDQAFMSSNIKIIVMGSSLSEIPREAFMNCAKLETVMLNEGLTSIGDMCFSNCTGLTSIYIPESVTKIGDGAFFAVGDNFTIEGKAGSYAETYASENDITFKAK